MARSVEAVNHGVPSPPDVKAWRHFGDGTAGEIIAARLQAYDSSTLSYIDVVVDASGNLGTTGGGASGHVTVDNASLAITAAALPLPTGAAKDSTLTDGTQRVGGTVAVTQSTSPWVTSFSAPQHVIVDSGTLGSVTVANASLAVTGPLTDTQLRASAVPVSLAAAPTTPVTGTFWQTTQPISAVSLPLPTNAAVELGGQLQQVTELLQQLVVETRIQSMQLSQGLNVPDDPAALRSDPAYLN